MERIAQGKALRGEPPLQHRERRLAVRARQRPGLRGSGIRAGAGLGEPAEKLGGHERAVDRQADGEAGLGCGQPGHDAGNRRPHLGPVVQHRERQLRPVPLPDGDALVARLPERPPRALRKRLSPEPGQRLRRAEPARGAAEEQDARQAFSRHASV